VSKYNLQPVSQPVNPFFHGYTFITLATSVDPDQLANAFHLIAMYTVIYTVHSVDPDQMAWMCQLIWIYTGHQSDNISVE
jgi:hypothetical protein